MSEQNQNNAKAVDVTHAQSVSDGMKAQRKLSELTGGEWNPIQELLLEIQAECEVNRVENNRGNTPLTKQIEILKEKIKEEYADDTGTQALLLNSMPSYPIIRGWTMTKEWEDAVMKKIRGDHIFDNKNRIRVFNSIFIRATEHQDMRAAELYFRLAGELGKPDKVERDETWERYRDLQQTLHRKRE